MAGADTVLPAHRFFLRIYYEDTDAGGVVYYANYLKFAERARTEMLRDRGINQNALLAETGLGFVVRKAELELLKPARLDDWITVQSSVTELAGASLRISQSLYKDNTLIATLDVLIVCVHLEQMRPARVPAEIRKRLES